MADNVKVLSDASLRAAGFGDAQLQAAAGRKDAYVGELEGIKYYRAQNELNIDLGDYQTRSAPIFDQQGEGNNRPLPRRRPE